MKKNISRPKEPEDKDKYCYDCKVCGHWKRDCNIKNTDQERKRLKIEYSKNKTIKKQYTKEGKIAILTTNKIGKKEEGLKYLPGKQKTKEDKSTQTEEHITKKNETAWAMEKEEYAKNLSILTNQLNEEKLQHQLTKNHLEFVIHQRNTDRK